MDNFTHTLTAVVLSQAGLNRKTRFATLALVLGSNLPDVDAVTWAGGSVTYLRYHRGLTHSVLGSLVLAGALAAALHWWGEKLPLKKIGPPLDARWLFAICWIATATHSFMDFTNSFGIRPFLPFSGRWYAWDIVWIIDPLLLAILAAGLAVPWLFRLISEEVGARKPDYRRGATASLIGVVLLWGVRDLAHRRVLTMLDSHSYADENPERLGAFPNPGNPLAWIGVVETDSAFHVLEANALDPDVDAERTRIFRKPSPTPALEAAMKTRTGTVFSDFARFPAAQVQEFEDGSEVVLRDLRFFSFVSDQPGFVAVIQLDKELRPQRETFNFSGGPRKPRPSLRRRVIFGGGPWALTARRRR